MLFIKLGDSANLLCLAFSDCNRLLIDELHLRQLLFISIFCSLAPWHADFPDYPRDWLFLVEPIP
jgi:hypothetical protein